MRGRKLAPLDLTPLSQDAPLTFDRMALAYLQDYQLHQYRSMGAARVRVEHLRRFFGGWTPEQMTAESIRQYQLRRRAEGAEASTVNRETSSLSRMFHLAIRCGHLPRMPFFPQRLRENPPRQGFFEHEEYLKVRAVLPPSFRHVLDFAYYSGWRRSEILNLTWSEVDLPGGVIRLSAGRSKTKTARVLPISPPLQAVLEKRQRRRTGDDPLVFRREGLTVREWRTALRDACRTANVPHRLLHDCRRTAARNLVRAGVPERVAMMLTGHTTRAIFDRYNIVNERELLTAGETLATYLTQRTSRKRRGRRNTPRRSTLGERAIARAADDRRPRSARYRFTRDALYALVWSDPLTTLAPRVGLSDRGLANVCARHGIPVPPQGYWAKKRAGHRVDTLPLPAGPDTMIEIKPSRPHTELGAK